MEIADAKNRLSSLEPKLRPEALVDFETFQTPHGQLHVMVSDRLRKKCRKEGIWKSAPMLAALKNAKYGFDATAPRSRGGADGIFQVDRNFRPANSMMKKLFRQFLDKPDPLVGVISEGLGTAPESWIAVRLVSHHLRLLGVVSGSDESSTLVLVDCDRDKH